MSIEKCIKERRSIRHFKHKPVDMELVRELLITATYAPSWKNGQCWEFVIVQDPEIAHKIQAAVPEGNPSYAGILEAPMNLIVIGNPEQSGDLGGKQYYMADAAMATYAFMLAAEKHGLGSVWVGWFDESLVAKAINLPVGKRILGILPFGYPNEEGTFKGRKALDEILQLDKY
ncbi:MAG: nitroreductase family protein [Clostridia bacterium]